MSFPRYPKYKDSGVEWLGEVPERWETLKLGYLLKSVPCYGVLVPDFEQDGVPMLRITDMEYGNADRKTLTTISHFLSTQYSRTIVALGDVVVSVVGTIGKAFQVDAGLAGVNLSRAVARLQLDASITAEFACWIFQSLQFRRYVDLVCVGTAQRVLNMADLTAFRIANPLVSEQTHIAAFLDQETAKIDELVAEQQRLIDLLKEKRQAVISHAVTKGLNPDTPLKPSGIEWLGDVPAHWKVERLKYSITKIEQGWSPQCESEPARENEWGVLKVGCGNRDKFDANEQKALPLNIAPLQNYEIKAGDILMSRGNTLDLVGMATFVERVRPRLLLSDLLYRFHPKPTRAEGAFLVFVLRSPGVRFQIERAATGTSASMKKIGQEVIRGFVVGLPPLSEQQAIIKFIGVETANIDALIAEAQRAIDLLQERRTALISAAVTGQIDVRELAVAEAA